MKYFITGNLGYVGPGIIREIRKRDPQAWIEGFDLGYFARQITTSSLCPEVYLNRQNYGDVRALSPKLLEDVDVVISLAAISNDPIGNRFEGPTMDINYLANVRLAKWCKEAGVRRFVFASSCSVYGAADDEARRENSPLNPLTAYARSKIHTEEDLEKMAGSEFQVTCLRFATACGMSERLRLDLVLNDFVAGAMTSGLIDILSDGTPWRPLIHVLDMARAIYWASHRSASSGGHFLTVNTGSNSWNFQVKDLALAVQQRMPEVRVQINTHAPPDKRSYRVNFDLFESLAHGFLPQYNLDDTIAGLLNGLREIEFNDPDFRKGDYIRLNIINQLREKSILNSELQIRHEFL